MSSESDAKRFCAAIVRYFSEPDRAFGENVELIATRATDDVAIILYREFPTGPILGQRYELTDYATLFDPHLSPEELADIAFTDEITDPSGRGTRRDVDWADGLVEDPSSIEWLG